MVKPLFFFLLLCLISSSCQLENTPVHKVIKKDPFLKKIAAPGSPYEVQILYTRIESDEYGFPIFKSYSYQVDSEKYFYPGSSVKLPVAILALEKLNELKMDDLDWNTAMLVDSLRPPQSNAWVDSTTHDLKPTIKRYIEKIFSVSDNDAYNRLYEFLGQQYINERLRKIGAFTNSKITHRLESPSFNDDDNRYTNRVRFLSEEKEIFVQKAQYCEKEFETVKTGLVKGVANKNIDGEFVQEPFEFTEKNSISLEDIEGILRRIIYPESVDEDQRFNLTRNQLNFLLKTMSTLPRESGIEEYKDTSYYDSYVKFLMFGDSKDTIPEYFKIYNKSGQAYGFLVDCAFLQDQKNDVEFFLTACIHVNENRVYNDNQYEYEEIGLPFLAKLGEKIYQYELSLKEPRSNSN
jgi:hypothetical protein